jgi:hypothetical protein
MRINPLAVVRARQCGIPQHVIKIILDYGQPVRKSGNLWEYRLGKREKSLLIGELKQLIQSLDKCTRKALVLDPDTDEIIRVYHSND